MIVKKLRLQRGWSQSQLAELSGLSARTVQRIEHGQTPSVESAKSLAAVFDVDFNEIKQDSDMTTTTLSQAENEALAYVSKLKSFYISLTVYIGVITSLACVNLLIDPSYLWFLWPALGWGVGIAFKAFALFAKSGFLTVEWEKRQVEKRLGRKL